MKTENIDFNKSELYSLDNYEDTQFSKDDVKNKLLLTNPLVLKNGDTIFIDYGYSNDRISAKKSVSKFFNDELKNILFETNESLKKNKLPQIKRIFISTTTNGKHSTKSNHYSGYALDISRINKIKIINTNYSFKLNRTLKDFFGNDYENLIDLTKKQIKVESNEYDLDLVFLHKIVFTLQSKIMEANRTRENFGPFLRTKFKKEDSGFISNYKVSGHQDHIHYSIR